MRDTSSRSATFCIARRRRAFHVHAFQRRANLHLEEYAHQVRPIRAGIGELLHGCLQVEIPALAAREMRDGRVNLRAVEAQLRHHLARRGDLRLRDAAIGLGDVPHDLERRREKPLADFEYAGAAARAAHGHDALVVEVAEDEADDGPPGTPEDQQTDDRRRRVFR